MTNPGTRHWTIGWPQERAPARSNSAFSAPHLARSQSPEKYHLRKSFKWYFWNKKKTDRILNVVPEQTRRFANRVAEFRIVRIRIILWKSGSLAENRKELILLDSQFVLENNQNNRKNQNFVGSKNRPSQLGLKMSIPCSHLCWTMQRARTSVPWLAGTRCNGANTASKIRIRQFFSK